MSWSFNNWGGARLQAADEFLNTGVVGTSLGGTACFGSNTCAEGYACVQGRCVKLTEGGSGGGTGGSYPGGYGGGGGSYPSGPCGDSPDGGGNSPGSGGCATASGGGGGPIGCTKPTCGEGTKGYGGDDTDCCGERCCRYQAGAGGNLTVNCYCGKCPGFTGQKCDSGAGCLSGVCINGYCADAKPCNKFCAEYYDTNGSHAAGCSDSDLCDECTACTGQNTGGSAYCEEKADAPPCHCNPESVGECDLCANDGSVVSGVCLECATIQNYDCGCGVAVTVKSCQPKGTSGLSITNQAQQAAKEACARLCGGAANPDPCAPIVTGKSVCSTGTCGDPGSGVPANGSGKNNVWTGCIQNGTEACVLYNEEDYSNLPSQCEECDCNCNNDCPPCQLCGADGKCYDNPSCDTASPCDTQAQECPDETCCPANQACYNGAYVTQDPAYLCCASPNQVADMHQFKLATNGCGQIATYTTRGPGILERSTSCITCNGQQGPCCSTNPGPGCASRPMYAVPNAVIGDSCDVIGYMALAFADNVAETICDVPPGWCGIDFPTVISNDLYRQNCCAP